MNAPKPWYRARNILLALLMLLVGWLGLETYRAVTATPGARVNYARKLNELVAEYQPGPADAPNGWDDWVAALAAFQALCDDARERHAGQLPTGDTAGRSWPYDFMSVGDAQAPADLQRNTLELIDRIAASDVHERLAAAAAHSRAQRTIPDTDRLIGVLLPELGQFRNVARYQRARMHLASQRADWNDFADSFDQLLQSARVCTHQATLIDHLVGYAIYRLAFDSLQQDLAGHDIDAGALRRMAASIERAAPGPLELGLRCEHFFALDTIQWTHTDNGRGDGRLILTEVHETLVDFGTPPGAMASLPDHKIINVLGIVFPSKKQTTAKAEEFYTQLIEWVNLTAPQRRAAEFQPDQWASQLGYGYLLLKMLVPALSKPADSRDVLLTSHAQARITVALERFRAEHGSYPDTLNQLVPTYLPELPLDPAVATPFVYQRSDETYPTNLAPYSLTPRGVDE